MLHAALQRKLAVAAALAALAIAIVAIVIVASRGSGGDARERPTLDDRSVKRDDVLRLRLFNATEVTGDGDRKGLRVTDAGLALALGLQTDDVLLALSGHRLERQGDLFVAVRVAAETEAQSIYVELARGEVVRWRVAGGMKLSSPDPSRAPPIPPTVVDPDDPALTAIVKVDDTHVVMPRATVEAVYADFEKLAGGVRVVPAIKNGKPDGFKFYAIRPRTLYDRLGFQNGDTLRAINGYDTAEISTLPDLLAKLRPTNQWTFDILRRGQPMILTATVK